MSCRRARYERALSRTGTSTTILRVRVARRKEGGSGLRTGLFGKTRKGRSRSIGGRIGVMLWFPPGRDVVQGLATRKEGSVEVRPTTDKRERQWDGWMGDVVPVSLSLSLARPCPSRPTHFAVGPERPPDHAVIEFCFRTCFSSAPLRCLGSTRLRIYPRCLDRLRRRRRKTTGSLNNGHGSRWRRWQRI